MRTLLILMPPSFFLSQHRLLYVVGHSDSGVLDTADSRFVTFPLVGQIHLLLGVVEVGVESEGA